MNSIPNNAIRQVLLLIIILLIGYVLFMYLKTFLPAFLGAYTLYVLMRKYMFILQGKHKWNRNLAAAVLMLLSFLIIMVPILILANMMTSRIAWAINHSSEILNSIKDFIAQYERRYEIQVFTDDNIKRISAMGAETLPKILGATFETLTTILIMYFILYFMLVDGRKMESLFYEWVPLKDENILLLRRELNLLVNSNAIGIPLIALIQGIVALIGYFLLGVDKPIFWFVITCIAAMMPVVGASLAYIPLSIVFFANGASGKGIIMLIYGFVVIGLSDNLFRFWLQKRLGDVHPLITVFGVIIGVNMFGFIGLIFGPILISLFLLMIKIYANEFSPRTPH
ncbi:AI-2E family transporter [Paraflavitalea sp. CAU 1676]|uniref:AI-2E family transporter n=1 Tax=Paraflavitalea sp. CAU 1676 TaxID=3032598 RepID=UPI0023DB327B|nr:AI-2E family transporter [Paraflavitalea sp. CAU 1676]MDF2191129.1 AI-2E family transporter [Paraflavitalea sp. CAU 1676]